MWNAFVRGIRLIVLVNESDIVKTDDDDLENLCNTYAYAVFFLDCTVRLKSNALLHYFTGKFDVIVGDHSLITICI